MCLATKQKKARIANKDITVYKVLKYDLSTIFYIFKYELGKLYETDIQRTNDQTFYSSEDGDYYGNLSNVIFYGNGFHSFRRLKMAKGEAYADRVLVKCIIPAGSEYITNAVGHVISNKIIVQEIL